MNTLDKVPHLKKNKITHTMTILGYALLISSQVPTSLMAQDIEKEINNDEIALEKIVVTARKREESLQDVPISITAFGEQQLESRGVTELTDLTESVPNFTFNGGGNTLSAIGIRGIVASTRNIGFESGIGVYIDQIYAGRPSAFNQNLDDIVQVEVLRGPQGTLFGRNTIGGAVNITTKTPGNDLEGKIKLTTGSYNRFNASGFISGPIVEDKLYAKASLYTINRDGFVDNEFDDTKLSDEDRKGYRFSLRFTPTDNLEFTFSADDMKERTNRLFTQWKSTDTSSAVYELYNIALADDISTAGIPNKTSQNFKPVENRDLSGQSLKIMWDSDSGARLVSITSQRDTDFLLKADDDASPFYSSHTTFSDTSEIFTQEFRWESSSEDNYNYLAGIYYQDSDAAADRSTMIGTPDALVGSTNGADFLVGSEGCLCSQSSVESESYGIFASGNYRFTDELTLALGLRYTEEDKSLIFDQTNTTFTGHPNVSTTPDINDSGVSGNISLSYSADDITYYASIGKGFKSGGFNPDIVPNDDISFDKETVISYEAGIKSTLLDNRLRLNAAVFFTDYQDQQVQRLGSSPAGGTGFQITNADSEITGAEIEVTALATENLQFSFSMGLMDTEYTDFDNCSTTADNAMVDGQFVQLSCNGNKLSYVPDVSYSLSSTYTIPMDFADLVARVEYNYKDDVFSEPSNFERTAVASTNTVNFRVSLLGNETAWEVSAWGKNIGDNEDEQFSWYLPPFQTTYSSYSIGSQYGVDFIYNY
jgi:iron complex outermembrane receptor protein